MGVINPGNMMEFKSTDSLFARIRRRLKSFDGVGMLDEGDWYYHVKEIMDRLGCGVYDELEAVIGVNNYKGPLPDGFTELYAAYKCTPTMGDSGSKSTIFPQTGFVMYIEDIYQPYRKCKNCYSAKVDYVDGTKFTTRTYIEGQPVIWNFQSPTLLRLSGNARGICNEKCKNIFAKSAYEFTINKGFVYTNFECDSIFMKYYALAVDAETGLPMIPDNTFIEKALEDYIIYRVLEDFWFNSSVPDLDRRYQAARINSDDSFAQALYWVKLPSFQNAIEQCRQERKNLRIYQQISW